MPIKKRVIDTPPVKWDYSVEAPHMTARLKVKERRVIIAEPQIHWTIGQRLDRVRDSCAQKGWILRNLKDGEIQ